MAGVKTNKEKVVTLHRGAISDIRSKLFERKSVEKIPIKPKAKKKAAPPVPAKPVNDTKDVIVEEISSNSIESTAKEDNNESTTSQPTDTVPPTKIENITINEAKKEEKTKPKRSSVISDFSALEKTCRLLGLTKEPAYIPEDIDIVEKKRHSSEGKQKKSKKKAAAKAEAIPKEEEKAKPKIDVVDKGLNEQKRNFFQELINQKKGLVKAEPAPLRSQKKRKTDLVAAFEEKTSVENKRNSMIKEDVKVTIFFKLFSTKPIAFLIVFSHCTKLIRNILRIKIVYLITILFQLKIDKSFWEMNYFI